MNSIEGMLGRLPQGMEVVDFVEHVLMLDPTMGKIVGEPFITREVREKILLLMVEGDHTNGPIGGLDIRLKEIYDRALRMVVEIQGSSVEIISAKLLEPRCGWRAIDNDLNWLVGMIKHGQLDMQELCRRIVIRVPTEWGYDDILEEWPESAAGSDTPAVYFFRTLVHRDSKRKKTLTDNKKVDITGGMKEAVNYGYRLMREAGQAYSMLYLEGE